ncbi:MAG TPA: HPF/RaiA family ribosome-associated protein [Myxococcota bacterium]|nr:HPF/RaiA family ribosome-associated protein [Myxococcota bacterium]
MPFKLSFKDMPHAEDVQRECESLAEELRAEFPETTRVEITLGHARDEYDAHVHVTGKDIDLAGRAKHRDSVALAAREAFQRAHAQLRKHHDKLIFKHRRDGHEKS